MTELAVWLLAFAWLPEIEAATFPPEAVCESAYRHAEKVYECARRRYDFAGSWPLKCEMEQARRVKDWLFCSWWISWSKATPEDRRWWLHRYRELSQGE